MAILEQDLPGFMDEDAQAHIDRVIEKYKQHINPGLARLLQFGGFGDVEDIGAGLRGYDAFRGAVSGLRGRVRRVLVRASASAHCRGREAAVGQNAAFHAHVFQRTAGGVGGKAGRNHARRFAIHVLLQQRNRSGRGRD